MKRSEMLKLMAKEIGNHTGNDSDCDLSIAKHVLDLIEEQGMLPPDNNHYSDEYGRWCYWEDEDKNA